MTQQTPPPPLLPPPDYMLPDPRSLATIAQSAHSLSPRLPPQGKLAVWIWFEPGNQADEGMLARLIDLKTRHSAKAMFQFWCVIRLRQLDPRLNYESVINDRIEAMPDVEGAIASKYAGGKVPAIIVANQADRRLVSVDQLGALLERPG